MMRTVGGTGSATRLTVSPIVSRARQGVAVSLGFQSSPSH